MSFCGTSGAVTSDAQMNTTFPGSILPPIAAGRITEGELKGRLTAQKLEDIYNTLIQQGDLISNTAYKAELSRVGNIKNVNNAAAQGILNNLGTKESATMRKIQQEFCFYYFRYKYALETLFDKLVLTSKNTTLQEADRAEITTKLNRAREFNDKLNDLIQITNYLAQKRSSEMREQNTEINTMNGELQVTFDTLQKHNKLLRSETSLSDLRTRMVEFTEEKNRSATNLLSLYGFMNLVAIGLLFYIARS
jgi:antitoxin component HigA of HigAB toxin-antitoxin module